MDITKENFKKMLPIIEKEIDAADFVSIDGEFTGLSDGRRVNPFDTPAEYYETLRSGSMDFLLIQFGLCIFKWDQEQNAFRHCGFNFYLFPGTSSGKNGLEKIFQCQSSSLNFLASHKFDFNKLFYNGISYLSTSEEMKLKESIETAHLRDKEYISSSNSTQTKTDGHIPIPDEDKPMIEEFCDQVKQFIEGGTENCIDLAVPNAFIRKLLYQEFEIRFLKDVSVETVSENNKRVLKVSRAKSADELKALLERKHKKDWENFNEGIGFTKIVRRISESGKLMVGHCLLLDLLHILHQFFAPLPEKYYSFKEFANCTFASIIDTMYLASTPEFKDKLPSLNLESLVKTLTTEPFKMPALIAEDTESVKGYSLDSDNYHEAGYDAFTTGLCFLAMANYLANQNKHTLIKANFNSKSKLLKSYMNKIYLFKTSFQDSPFIHLGGTEAIPSRSHVFHITFPAKWKRSNINELFSSFGGIYTSFIDDTTAFVALRKKNLSSKVLKTLRRHNSPYKIITYEQFKMKPVKNPFKYVKPVQESHSEPIYNPLVDKEGTEPVVTEPEDIGEPISRESIVPVVADESCKQVNSRRRTISASSGENGIAIKRRRTASGMFQVVKDDLPPVTSAKSKDAVIRSSFDENNDWE